jgi:HAMP domain-containing protein
MSKWEEVLWAELDELEKTVQIVTLGEWITRINQHLLSELAGKRREIILELVENGWDHGLLADEIGAKRNTISRLASEARVARRQAA